MNIKTPYNNGLNCRNRYLYYVRYDETISNDPYIKINSPEKIIHHEQIVVLYSGHLLEYQKHYNLEENLSKIVLIKVFIPVKVLTARDIVEIYIYDYS
jgi:hypothetical protein